MTGRRPDKTGVYNNYKNPDWRKTGKDAGSWITMPGYLKDEAGHVTIGGGKTFHPNCPPDFDGDRSWNNTFMDYFPFEYFTEGDKYCPNHAKGSTAGGDGASSIDTWCVLPSDAHEGAFYDYRLANHTIDSLKKAKEAGLPFAVFAGFARPHVPLRVPQRIWDMYGPANDSSHFPTAKYGTLSEGFPPIAYHRQAHYRYNNYSVPTLPEEIWAPNFTQVTVPTEVQQEVRRAYYSAITWMDEQLGRILDALDDLGLADDTLVAVHGDHGYRIGENNQYMKEQLGEQVSRVPLIVRAPWKPQTAGRATFARANLVDMYATIAELIGGPTPSQAGDLDGASLAWVFEDPQHSVPLAEAASPEYVRRHAALAAEEDAPASLLSIAERLRDGGLPNGTVSFNQFPHCAADPGPGAPPEWWDDGSCGEGHTWFMGYSCRSSRWRYTEWRVFSPSNQSSPWDGAPHAVQLYDHAGDTGNTFDGPFERVNLAGDPAHKGDQEALAQLIKAFFQPRQEQLA